MKFLVLLLVLLAEKLFPGLRRGIQRDGWWLDLRRRHEQPGRPWLALAWLVLLPLFIVWLALKVLEPVLHGWMAVLLHLWILLYSLGRGSVWAELDGFRQAWQRGDGEAAGLVAAGSLGIVAEGEGDLFERVQARLLWLGYQGFFAVVFWYLLLGPLVALAYRLLALAEQHGQTPDLRERAGQLRHVLDWLPVRALAASLALVGNYVNVLQALRPALLSWAVPAEALLGDIARRSGENLEANRGDAGLARLEGLLSLLRRAAALWYVLVALWLFID
ncbi:regulatory signaling modulator protein AmpE [Stutzerimonas tarimensis]|uniref:Regulatory signaling modulator protein AmpE n=1 Tax=Stutzerimonas tarimensis TaxID=1507735 RepID=A0ABV7T3G1_9GAMM